jgi:hypothetical protein
MCGGGLRGGRSGWVKCSDVAVVVTVRLKKRGARLYGGCRGLGLAGQGAAGGYEWCVYGNRCVELSYRRRPPAQPLGQQGSLQSLKPGPRRPTLLDSTIVCSSLQLCLVVSCWFACESCRVSKSTSFSSTSHTYVCVSQCHQTMHSYADALIVSLG